MASQFLITALNVAGSSEAVELAVAVKQFYVKITYYGRMSQINQINAATYAIIDPLFSPHFTVSLK